MVIVLLMQHKLDDAEKQIHEALSRQPGNVRMLTLKSLLLLKRGDYRAAIREGQKVLRVDPTPSNVHKVLGEASSRLGLYGPARQYWLDYFQAHPMDLEAALALVYLADRMHDRELLRWTAGKIKSLKGDDGWQELFRVIEHQKNINDLLFSIDPWTLLPLIGEGLEEGKT